MGRRAFSNVPLMVWQLLGFSYQTWPSPHLLSKENIAHAIIRELKECQVYWFCLCHSSHVIKCVCEEGVLFSFIFETTHKILGSVLGGLETSLRTRTQGEILEMKAWLRTSSEWGVGWDLWQVDLSEAAASSSQRCS